MKNPEIPEHGANTKAYTNVEQPQPDHHRFPATHLTSSEFDTSFVHSTLASDQGIDQFATSLDAAYEGLEGATESWRGDASELFT